MTTAMRFSVTVIALCASVHQAAAAPNDSESANPGARGPTRQVKRGPIDPYAATAPVAATPTATPVPPRAKPTTSATKTIDPYNVSAPLPDAAVAPSTTLRAQNRRNVAPTAPPRRASTTATKTIDPYAEFANATAPMPNPYAVPVSPTVIPPAPVSSAANAPVPILRQPTPTPASPLTPAAPLAAAPPPPRIMLSNQSSLAGLLAVARLDGWLLTDHGGSNPIAQELVLGDNPPAVPTQRWFYLVPQKGEPSLICQTADCGLFAVAGKRLPYAGYRDLPATLKTALKGKLTLAAEYATKSVGPSVSRLDASNVALLRGLGITLRSSDTLVQYTRAMWGAEGLASHLVAAHHVQELRREAFATMSGRLRAGQPMTEWDLQQQLIRSMKMRGITGPAPIVAFAAHTADAAYRVTNQSSKTLQRGELVLVRIAARVDKPDSVFAALTGMAIADDKVPAPVARAFEAVTSARDLALATLAERKSKRPGLKGFEIDAMVRNLLSQNGVGKAIVHATGHSLDTRLDGRGADLDDTTTHDSRTIMTGTGFAVGPGLYFHGDAEFGVRAEVSVFATSTGIEVTTPAQDSIELLLK